MVSKPNPASSSLISRSSCRSRRRWSHIGYAHNLPRNEFPVFDDAGDVEILVSAGGKTNRYLLHRVILAQCSKFFSASISKEWWRESGLAGRFGDDEEEIEEKNEKGERWMYELDMGDGLHDVPVLVQRNINRLSTNLGSSEIRPPPPPVRNKPGDASHQSFSRSESVISHQSSHSSPSYLCRDATSLRQSYHNMFLIFYNYPPELDPSCISRAYHQCKALLSLADLYDALPVVGPRIEHHLLRFQSALWRHIAKYPSSYLHLGYFTQSHSIFQEAFVHALGRWPEMEYYIRERLPLRVTRLMQEKYRDLSELVRRVEINLWSLTLYTADGERVTPQNSYLDWLVMSFFREWLAECSTGPSSLTTVQSIRKIRDTMTAGSSTESEAKIAAQSRYNMTVQKENLQALSRNIYDRNSLKTSHRLSACSSRSIQSLHTILPAALLAIGHSTSLEPSYLSHEDCKHFLKLNENLYTRSNLRNFKQRLDEVRECARQVVRPVIESYLNNRTHMEEYLVCIGVEEGEWPWERNR